MKNVSEFGICRFYSFYLLDNSKKFSISFLSSVNTHTGEKLFNFIERVELKNCRPPPNLKLMNTPKKLANTTENVNHYQINTLQTAQITNKQRRYRHRDKSKTPLDGVNKHPSLNS